MGKRTFSQRGTKTGRSQERAAKTQAKKAAEALEAEAEDAGDYVPISPPASPVPEPSDDGDRCLSPLAERDTGYQGITWGMTHWWEEPSMTVHGEEYYQVQVTDYANDRAGIFTVKDSVLTVDFVACVLKEMYGFEDSHHAFLTCNRLSTSTKPNDEPWAMSAFVHDARLPENEPIGMALTSNLCRRNGVWKDMRVASRGRAPANWGH